MEQSPRTMKIYCLTVALFFFLFGITIAIMGIFAPYRFIMEAGAGLQFVVGGVFLFFAVYIKSRSS